MRILSLDLTNIFGFRKAVFNFDPQLSMLHGPNGCGKSNILNIVNTLCSPRQFFGRNFSMYFRKMILHEDYDPAYASYAWDGFAGPMKAIATFDIDGEKKQVSLEVNPALVKRIEDCAKDSSRMEEYSDLITKVGIIKNELPTEQMSYAFLTDADNPSNMSKFQINAEGAEKFLDIARAVYGYECLLEKHVYEFDSSVGKDIDFMTDFVVVKNDDGERHNPVRVHYRRMSAGEKKIATLLKQMCTPSQYNSYDIFLIDNLELHIYAKRHKALVDKLRQHFSDKQIIATTHSAVLIGIDDIPPYLPIHQLFDVIDIRKKCGIE